MIVKSHFPSNERVMDAAKALIFVVRNPYDAIIAEYKRRRGHGHTSTVKESVFKEKMWFQVCKTIYTHALYNSRIHQDSWMGGEDLQKM